MCIENSVFQIRPRRYAKKTAFFIHVGVKQGAQPPRKMEEENNKTLELAGVFGLKRLKTPVFNSVYQLAQIVTKNNRGPSPMLFT
jgi:hypothetical protein